MTVKELKVAIQNLPDDMPVAINESDAEATGSASEVVICNGKEDAPYDKGDGLYVIAAWCRKNGRPHPISSNDTKVCIIQT